MKIGLVTACYKPVINGVTQMVSLYKQYLTELGHEVIIFTLGEPDPSDEEDNVIRSPAVPLGGTGYYFGFRYSWEAQRLLREMDILHCHHLVMGMELAYRYGSCPIVYTNHTRYDLYAGSVSSLPQPTADAVMRQIWPQLTDCCDVVIAPSAGIAEVMRRFGVGRPIEIIENGIELVRYWSPANPMKRVSLGYDESTILISYVGRLSAEKGVDRLLQQFAFARAVMPVIELLIIGDGPQRSELEQLVTQLDVADSVRFVGRIPSIQIPDYLAATDLFATASVSEVHPLTIIEAMAAGLPVVAITSPGIDETVVHGQSGYVVESVEGISAALVALAGSPTLLKQMGGNAKIASQKYDIRDTVARTVTLYERVKAIRPDLQRIGQLRWLSESISEGLRPVTAPISRFWREQYLDVMGETNSLQGHVKSKTERHG